MLLEVRTCTPIPGGISICSMSKTSKVAIAVVGVLVVVVAGGLYWFLRDDAPAPVSLDAATGAVAPDGDGAAGSANGTGADGDEADEAAVQGSWVVDTETGEFDWETATGTFAGFRVEEELANIGSSTAVGRTGEVSGGLTIDGSRVTKADFAVGMASLRTNNNMRDSRVRQALNTTRFPEARLSLAEPIELPGGAASGEKIEVTAKARLSLHGVTRDVDVSIEAQYVEDRIVIVGSTELVFSDFDIEVPSSPVVLSVQDHGIMEFQALMERR